MQPDFSERGIAYGFGQALQRHTVGVRAARAAALLDQSGGAAHLERSLDLVERVAVVAHDLTGLRDVPQFGRATKPLILIGLYEAGL